MRLTAGDVIHLTWLVFVLYWFLSALRVNKMKKREPVAQRLTYLWIIVLAAFLLYAFAPSAFLRGRFVPRLRWIDALGAALTVAGVGFAIWARAHIGPYWSGSVSLREGHRHIRTGPYARMRHPIYSGVLLALAGTCLYMGLYRALAIFVIVLAGFTIKAKKEEALLANEFGAAFEEHRRHTGFLLPKF